MSSEVVILLSNFPDAAAARNAVRTLVEERLIACGNIIPGIESIYEWKGTLETSAEVMVVCKTSASSAPDAMARLRALHPYEVPEILQIPVSAGWPDYLAWVAGGTGGPPVASGGPPDASLRAAQPESLKGSLREKVSGEPPGTTGGPPVPPSRAAVCPPRSDKSPDS